MDQEVITGDKSKSLFRRKKPFRLIVRQYWPLYVMLLPALIYYVLICYLPMGGLVLAFKNYKFNLGILKSPWVGLDYFETFFRSYDSRRLIRNTLTVGIIKCVIEFPFPVILALMLNEIRAIKFKRISQTISYMPHFFSSVIVVTILQKAFAPNMGIVNQFKGLFGGDTSTFYMMDAAYFYILLFIMDLWRNIGWSSILYLSAMSAIDPALYEAAQMDGSNRFQRMRYITLPGIKGTIGLLFIMGIGGLLSSGFEQILLLRTPGNMSVADTLDVYVVNIGLAGGQFGYATAIGLIQGVVGMIMVIAFNNLSKRTTDVALW